MIRTSKLPQWKMHLLYYNELTITRNCHYYHTPAVYDWVGTPDCLINPSTYELKNNFCGWLIHRDTALTRRGRLRTHDYPLVYYTSWLCARRAILEPHESYNFKVLPHVIPHLSRFFIANHHRARNCRALVCTCLSGKDRIRLQLLQSTYSMYKSV